jgi:hypothetical protein
VVTANRLRDGRVVWLADGDTWTENPRSAKVFIGSAVDAGLAAGTEAERRQRVVGPYAVVVARNPDGPSPLSMREQIRASGPSIAA